MGFSMSLPSDCKILIVDDSRNMRELIMAILYEMGYKKNLQAASVDKAFEILNQEYDSEEPVQLILSDYDMPEKNGYDFITQIRKDEKFKNLPFIVISAHGQFNAIIDIISAGADSFISKPFEKADLLEKFTAAWEKHK